VDNKPIALKFFKHSGIHKWLPESIVSNELDYEKNFTFSEFFLSHKKMNNNNENTVNNNRMLPSEVACLLRASHINGVVKLLDYLPMNEEVHLDDTKNNESIIGIVLERNPNEICLFDYLMHKQVLDESEAFIIIKQIVHISLELLQAGILHGDLKSENILIEPKNKTIKIIDFGSAQLIDLPSLKRVHSRCSNASNLSNTSACTNSCINRLVKTFRGTNLYKPPEYILHHCFYPRPSTVWTIGIILYDMLFGHFPFESDTEILEHKDKELAFTRNDLSAELKDLLKKMLSFYVADRIVIENILIHPWMLNK
jgi:serine/threonine protein kinase